MKARIDPGLCIGCGACIAVCPAGAIRMLPGWRAEVSVGLCTGCGSCAGICHRGAASLASPGVRPRNRFPTILR